MALVFLFRPQSMTRAQYEEGIRQLEAAGQGSPAGRLYHAMGLETPLYTPFFVASRVTGWSAHVIEQLEHNRLIRPRADYIGPSYPQHWVPTEQR